MGLGRSRVLAVALGWWLGVLGVLAAPGSSSSHWGVEHVGVPWVSPKGQPQEQDEGLGPCEETSSCAEPYMGMGPRVPLGAGAGTREVGSAVEETLAKPSLSLVTGAQATCRGVTGVLAGCAGAQTGPQGDGGDAWVCWCGCVRRWGLPVRGCPSGAHRH